MTRIDVRIGPRRLPGLLDMPEGELHGLVIFAHGSGSSRLSPRNSSSHANCTHAASRHCCSTC